MPTVTAAESLLSGYHEELLKSCAFEVGVVVGSLSSGRFSIYLLIKSPLPDARPWKGPSDVEADWLAEHARQVQFALPGGVSVLGFYVFCKTADYKAVEERVARGLVKVAASQTSASPVAAAMVSAAVGEAPSPPESQLIMHMASDSRRIVCRTATPGAKSTDVSDLKTPRALPTVHRLTARLAVDVQSWVRVPEEASAKARTKAVIRALERVLKGALRPLATAVAVVDDMTVEEAERPVSVLPGGTSHTVRFLARSPPPSGAARAEGEGDRVYLLRCRGVVRGLAYAGPKEAISAALLALKKDLAATLSRRLDLGVEDLVDLMDCGPEDAQAEADEDEEEGGEDDDVECEDPLIAGALLGVGGGPSVIALPKRNFLSTSASMQEPLFLCDHVSAAETTADVVERVDLMLDLRPPTGERLPDSEPFGSKRVLKALATEEKSRAAAASAPVTAPVAASANAATDAKASSAGDKNGASRPALILAAVVALLAVVGAAVGITAGKSPGVPPEHPLASGNDEGSGDVAAEHTLDDEVE